MQNKLKKHLFVGFLFTSVVGTLFHFLYEWTNQNFLIGLIAPINESVWEHIKLLYFPMLLYAIYVVPKLTEKFPCISYGLTASILLGILLIPVLYYTYTGILGTHYAVVDIGIYYLSVAIAYYTAYRFTLSCHGQKYYPYYKWLLFLSTISFFLFTIMPPALPLFMAP